MDEGRIEEFPSAVGGKKIREPPKKEQQPRMKYSGNET